MSTELKPCPFCGAQPSRADRPRSDSESNPGEPTHVWFASCFCGTYSVRAWQMGFSEDEIASRWNNRPRERIPAAEAVIRAAVAWHEEPALDCTSDELADAVDALLAAQPEWKP